MPHAATSRDTLYAMDSPSSIRSTVVGCGGAVDRGGRQANTGRSASRAPPAPTRASGAILLDDPLEGILEVRACEGGVRLAWHGSDRPPFPALHACPLRRHAHCGAEGLGQRGRGLTRTELLGRTAHELHILLDRGLGLVAQRAH